MYILFTLIGMISDAFIDCGSYHSISKDTQNGPYKFYFCFGFFSFLTVIAIYALDLSETGLMPWELVKEYPAVLLSGGFYVLSLIISAISYRFIGVSVRNAIANCDSLILVLILIIINFFTGRASFAVEMLTPFRLIGFIMITVSIIVLPFCGESRAVVSEQTENTGRRVAVIGILLALLSTILDAMDSVIDNLVLGNGVADSWDYTSAFGFVVTVASVVVYIFLWVREKRPYNPFKKSERLLLQTGFAGVLASVLYLLAIAESPLITDALWSSYPAIDLIAAKVFLKEKLQKKQLICVSLIVLGAVIFCVADLFV